MEIKDLTVLEKFAEEFVSIVEKHCKYAIVSGFVAIAHGRTRGTEDIDIIIEKLNKSAFSKLHSDLKRNKFICLQSDDLKEIYDYLINNTSVRYVEEDKPLIQMELKFVRDELDEYQLETRKKLPLTGLDLYCSSIEMNLAFKEELLKSKKDLEDAKYLREVYKDKINENEVEKIKGMIRRYRLK